MRPSVRDADRATLRELMRYGRHVGVANVINYGNGECRGDGRRTRLGAAALGYFSVARRFAIDARQRARQHPRAGRLRGLRQAPGRHRGFPEGLARRTCSDLHWSLLPATIGIVFDRRAARARPFSAKVARCGRPAPDPGAERHRPDVLGHASRGIPGAHRPHYRSFASAAYLVLVVPALVIGASGGGSTARPGPSSSPTRSSAFPWSSS